MKRTAIIVFSLFAVVLVIGTLRDPDFWSTPDQRGDALFRAGKFAEAAKTYIDPARRNIATVTSKRQPKHSREYRERSGF